MVESLDTIAALGGPSLKESTFRVDAAVQAMDELGVQTLSLIGGSWAFQARGTSQVSMADRMRAYAVEEKGLDEAAILTVDGTHDTIGDAIRARLELLVPGYKEDMSRRQLIANHLKNALGQDIS